MGIQVKICGIASADAADAALRAGADFVGLVLCPGSPRHLSCAGAATLAARMRGRTRIVALLADPDDDELDRAIAAVDPDYIQLHGHETPERTAFVRAHFRKPVIKAVAVAEAADLAALVDVERVADMLLFDAKTQAGATLPGGHGSAFDWRLLRSRTIGRPWLLAGGLDASNVARAIRIANAPGVDVSSGVEFAPGVKSGEAIREFVRAARSVASVEENPA